MLVEDEAALRIAVEKALLSFGYEVCSVSTLADMFQMLRTHSDFSVLLLDLSLPDGDGLDVCASIRESSEIGIIMITGRTDNVDRIIGLETGADDYLSKPFDFRELVARIKSLTRRLSTKSVNSTASVYHFDNWCFDISLLKLENQETGLDVALTQHEAQLLESLLAANGNPLSRDELFSIVSGRPYHPDDRSIDNMISRIRKKLSLVDDTSNYIRSVRGTGYRFVGTITETTDPASD